MKIDMVIMARMAGASDITSYGYTTWVGTSTNDFLERFAEAVRASERQACASLCETLRNDVATQCAVLIRQRNTKND
jgi:hypothetical protein